MPAPGPSPLVDVRAPTTDPRAVVALACGVASLLGLGPLTGLPAIVLGATARRRVDRSGGTLRGHGLAAGGIVTGLFGTGLALVVLLGFLSGAFNPGTGDRAGVDRAVRTPAAPGVTSGSRSYGPLDVVDLDRRVSLAEQLLRVSAAAASAQRTVVLQTYVQRSRECAEVAAALPDPRMQTALAKVTLVRVDVEAFASELSGMRVETRSAPWFYTLDALGRPMDALSADAWDDNVPENMAPVLAAFVRGRGMP